MYKGNLDSEDNNSVSGQLNKYSIPNLLVYLQNKGQTGTLDIISKFETTIFIDQGSPYFAAGSSAETLLGKILLNKNKITKYQYDRAVEEINKNKETRIGEILVSLGMITPHELNEFLEMQLREKILETFLYLDGEFNFTVTDGIRDDLFYSKLNPSELIHEGFNRYVFAADTNFDLVGMEIKESIKEDVSILGLGPKELRLVQLLAKNNSLSELEATGQFKKDEILRVILLLGLHERIEFKSISVNDFLMDVLRKYSNLNPLPTTEGSNYKIRESELTDPTGEVLILDDILEATGEREKLDLSMEEVSVNNNDEPKIIHEPGIEFETAAEKADSHSDDNEPEMDYVEINSDITDEKKLEVNHNISDVSFQDSYEGNQESIELEKESNDEVSPDGSESSPEPQQPEADMNDSENEIISFFESIQGIEDHYEILNVKTDASAEEIKESYFELIKKFHPDANMNFPEDIRVKSERIFAKVTKAYEVLSNEEKRTAYDGKEELGNIREKANSLYEAEIIYTEGEMLLRQRNFSEAEEKFKQAIELNPNEAAYVGIKAWAKYLGAPDKDVVYEDTKNELKKAIDMDQGNAENYYYLASVYKFADNLGSAEKYFTEAIKKDPNYIEAKRELRLLKSRKDKGISSKSSTKKIEKKFWSGLFKK